MLKYYNSAGLNFYFTQFQLKKAVWNKHQNEIRILLWNCLLSKQMRTQSNNINGKRCELCSKVTIKALEQYQLMWFW